jgi:thiol-disulfide isomerase/thioredoxin
VCRLPAILFVLIVGAGLPGCSLFKKTTNNDPPPANQTPPPKFPTSGDPATPTSGTGRGNSILAGRVLDGTSRPPANTSIVVVRVDGKEEKKEDDIPVSAEGYFTINNLQSGGQYKLIARGKTGDHMVAGIHIATAPSPRVLIQMREDLVTASIPPLPEHFDTLKQKKADTVARESTPHPTPPLPNPSGAANTSWQPGNGGTNAVPGDAGLPAVQISAPTGPVAQAPAFAALPPLEIPRPQTPPMQARIAPLEVPLPPRTADPPENLGPARVPSCVLVGRQLVNFALNDINGEPWELRTSRKGKLVLIDFWGTWCGPCRQTMPALKGLQQKYSGAGLEVVGIAYEQGGTPQEQAYRVNETCQKLLINYRQLLGSGENCVVRRQLGVRGFPTLILIDEQGTILWRHEGRPTDNDRDELERLIQSRLRTTAY